MVPVDTEPTLEAILDVVLHPESTNGTPVTGLFSVAIAPEENGIGNPALLVGRSVTFCLSTRREKNNVRWCVPSSNFKHSC